MSLTSYRAAPSTSPARTNRLAENGTFVSTETLHCRLTRQVPVEVVEEDLLEQMGSSFSWVISAPTIRQGCANLHQYSEGREGYQPRNGRLGDRKPAGRQAAALLLARVPPPRERRRLEGRPRLTEGNEAAGTLVPQVSIRMTLRRLRKMPSTPITNRIADTVR